jgi:hypothetical protein
MKVKCVDKSTPRSDGQPGMPTGLTIGKVYKVGEVLNGGKTDQYSIINDDFRIARYSQCRFEVVDDTPVRDLRTEFNWLTTELRTRIKELEAQRVW